MLPIGKLLSSPSMVRVERRQVRRMLIAQNDRTSDIASPRGRTLGPATSAEIWCGEMFAALLGGIAALQNKEPDTQQSRVCRTGLPCNPHGGPRTSKQWAQEKWRKEKGR